MTEQNRGNVRYTFLFDAIHPDPVIAREVVIEALLLALIAARAGLALGLGYAPDGHVRDTVRWALEQTSIDAIKATLPIHEQRW